MKLIDIPHKTTAFSEIAKLIDPNNDYLREFPLSKTIFL
jgi:hypothetical protein